MRGPSSPSDPAAGHPLVGVLAVATLLVLASVGLFAFGLAVVSLRYGNLEYRVYSTGVAVYNERHDALVRFVPFRRIERCTCYRGPVSRLFGVGSVSLYLEDGPGAGRFRTVFSSGNSRSFGADDDPDVLLRALPDYEDAYESIERRR